MVLQGWQQSTADQVPLLAAGVEIYEYPLGLLHTKSITADRQIALVGSANMDRRSLQLNFELSAANVIAPAR